MPTEVHRRALQRALELTGDVDALARQLKVPSTAVRFWTHGNQPLPPDIFLKIVDLLLDHSIAELHPPAPRKGEAPPGRNTSDS
jgi:hypothetical protein